MNHFFLSTARGRWWLLLLLACSVSNLLWGQVAPGGVGTNLQVWLKAPVASNNLSSSWLDASANGNDAVYSGINTYQVRANEMNFNPALQIDDEHFDVPVNINGREVHIFTIYRLNQDSDLPLWGNSTGTTNNEHRQMWTKTYSQTGAGVGTHTTGNIAGKVFLNHTTYTAPSTNMTVYSSRQPLASSTAAPLLTSNLDTGFVLGGSHGGNRYSTPGNTALGAGPLYLAECIVYTGRSIPPNNYDYVRSYLALKYGLTLDHAYSLSSGRSVWNNPIYNHRVTGIVNDAGSGLLQPTSRSEEAGSVLTLAAVDPTELTGSILAPITEGALIVGDNDLPTNSTAAVPGQYGGFYLGRAERLARTWTVRTTRNLSLPSGVNLSFDNPTLPASFQPGDVVLLVASDDDFTQGVRAYPLSLNSGVYTATDVQLNNDEFFTIAQPTASLWAMADGAGNRVANGRVEELRNQLGNYNHLMGKEAGNNGTTNGRDYPHYQNATSASSTMNYHPYAELNDNNDRNCFFIPRYRGLGNRSATTFTVLRRSDNDSPNGEAWFSYSDVMGRDNEWLQADPRDIRIAVQAGGLGNHTGGNFTNNRPALITNTVDVDSQTTVVAYDGTIRGPISNGGSRPLVRDGGLVIGQEQDGYDDGFDRGQEWNGDFAEIIVLNRAATPQEQTHIETYLAFKYGITKSTPSEMVGYATPVWDPTTAPAQGYNHAVTAVGLDPNFNWNQTRSRNQSDGGVRLTLENASVVLPRGDTTAVLVVGDDDGNFDAMTPLNAPSDYYTSDRVWYARNPGNKVRSVDLRFKLPTGVTDNPTSVNLLINSTNLFQFPARANYIGILVDSVTVLFSNVVLRDGDYFCIAEERERVYINHTALWPGTFEACPGDPTTFYYYGLPAAPTRILFTNTTGGSTSVPVVHIPDTSGRPAVSGWVRVTIPSDARTGNVFLYDRNTPLFPYDEVFIVHNPELRLYADNNPICAMRPVQIKAFPEGGTFWGEAHGGPLPALPSIIDSTGWLDGEFAGWSTINDSVRHLRVRYDYQPTYSDGAACTGIVSSFDTFVVRDNRFQRLQFRPIRPVNGSNAYAMVMDSNVVLQASPNLLDPSFRRYGFPVDFYGTYVNEPVPGVYNFLSTQALNGRSRNETAITITYDNGGCLGILESDIVVFEPARILGLPDTLCIQANPVVVMRDTSPESRYFTNRDTLLSGSFRYESFYRYNRVTRLLTANPAFQAAIQVVDTNTVGRERFAINPQALPAGTTRLVVEMRYDVLTTTVRTNPSVLGGNPDTTYSAYYFPTFDTITLTPRPILTMQGLDPSYCPEVALDTLQVTPQYEYAPRTRFSVMVTDINGNFVFRDTLRTPMIVEPEAIYQRFRPMANYDLDFYVAYTVERYGCTDEVRDTAHMVTPLKPYFLLDSAYCASPTPIQLNGSWLPGTTGPRAAGVFTAQPGLTAQGLLTTATMGPGRHNIEYSYVDRDGCRTSYNDSIYIRQPPLVELYVDSSNIGVQFCGSDEPVKMHYLLLGGSAIDSVAYTGVGVFADTFNPNAISVANSGIGPGSGGTVNVILDVTDVFGCQGQDAMLIRVERAPVVSIDTAFNNRPTVLNSGLNTDHSYCYNYPDINVVTLPHYIDSLNVRRGQFTGRGIYTRNDSVFYTPGLVDEGVIDTVVYTYTTPLGCANSDVAHIFIDTIPDVRLTGLQPTYCATADTVHLTGVPDLRNGRPGGNSGYGGRGININTGVLDFRSAGVGQLIYSYRFEDNNLCVGIDYDTIYVHPGPSADFEGFNSRQEYCRDAPPELWVSRNDTTPPSFYFFSVDSGLAFIDSVGWFNPDPSNGTLPNIDVVGNQSIRYTYVDTNGCAATKTVNIFIHPTPDIVLTGLDSAYCLNGGTDQISMSEPAVPDSATQRLGHFSVQSNILTFTPNYDTAGVKPFVLTYTNARTLCSDTIRGLTRVFPQSTVAFEMDSSYCETEEDFLLDTLGAPLGGEFTGPGVTVTANQSVFTPIRAGALPTQHTIAYTIRDTFFYGAGMADSLFCNSAVTQDVWVRPLPMGQLIRPFQGQKFCATDTAQRFWYAGATNLLLNHSITGQHVTYNTDTIGIDSVIIGGVIYTTAIVDTVFYFNPSMVTTGASDALYTVSNTYGCFDTATYTFIVIPEATRPFFALDDTLCSSDGPQLLTALPSGGTFFRNGDTIPLSANLLPYYTTHRDSIQGAFRTDTVVYDVTYGDGACRAQDTTVVTLYRSPSATFTHGWASDTFCFGMDPVALFPSVPGGEFTGDGIRRGSSVFETQILNPGVRQVTYTITDSSTLCASSSEQTFYVYGQPDVTYRAIGGCVNDTVRFIPDSIIAGIDNFYNNVLFDSITNVEWVLTPDTSVVGVLDSNRVLPLNFIYDDPGVYFTQLIVTNQVHCIDTHTVRLIVSPGVDNFPYAEDFEGDDGGYYAEGRTPTQDILWEWGVDTTNEGIWRNPNNQFWATGLNRAYGLREDARLYTPCFDISGLERPMIKLDYWSDTEEGVDGAVVEYQKRDGTWEPLGAVGRGVGWYNETIIAGRPGDQSLAPRGWSRKDYAWQQGRYRLDAYRDSVDVLRLRIAFGSSEFSDLSRYLDGFGVDNVVVRNRTRNVLLETTTNRGQTDMHSANTRVYDLVSSPSLYKDVIMGQYHTGFPVGDRYNSGIDDFLRTRLLNAGTIGNGSAFIDGSTSYFVADLSEEKFEADMLADPKFDVWVDQFQYASGTFHVNATVVARDTMPEEDYNIYVLIVEDTLAYSNNPQRGEWLHKVVRHAERPYLDRTAWSPGQTERVSVSWTHAGYRPHHFRAIVFVESRDANTIREVHQVATTPNLDGIFIGVDPVEAHIQYNELTSLTLFPNPAADQFHVQFEQPLNTDYQWKLVDLRGVEVQTGTITTGNDRLTVPCQQYPSGTYMLLLHNDNVFAQRKVVLRR